MNREQIIVILKLLKIAYPKFYVNMTKDEAENTINLWLDMFKSDNPQTVMIATKELISNFKFPPTIADVKEQIAKITVKKTDLTEEWNALQKAISNSLYNSVESFEKLPSIAKKFVGSPAQLKEIAMMDSDVVHSVVKGQFFKQAEVLQKRQEEDDRMLPETRKLKEMIASIGQDINLLTD